MNIHEAAAYRTVHSFPGGSKALGPMVGKSDALLRSLVNPNTPTHKLGHLEAIELSKVTGDHSMLEAWAAECGYVLVRAEPHRCDKPIPNQMMRLTAEIGEFANVVANALADGVLTSNERRAIHKESVDCLSAIHGVTGSAYQLAGAH